MVPCAKSERVTKWHCYIVYKYKLAYSYAEDTHETPLYLVNTPKRDLIRQWNKILEGPQNYLNSESLNTYIIWRKDICKEQPALPEAQMSIPSEASTDDSEIRHCSLCWILHGVDKPRAGNDLKVYELSVILESWQVYWTVCGCNPELLHGMPVEMWLAEPCICVINYRHHAYLVYILLL